MGETKLRRGGTLNKALREAGRPDLAVKKSPDDDFGNLPDDLGTPTERVLLTADGQEYSVIGHVKRRRVRWLYPGRIASGKLNILAGDPESG